MKKTLCVLAIISMVALSGCTNKGNEEETIKIGDDVIIHLPNNKEADRTSADDLWVLNEKVSKSEATNLNGLEECIKVSISSSKELLDKKINKEDNILNSYIEDLSAMGLGIGHYFVPHYSPDNEMTWEMSINSESYDIEYVCASLKCIPEFITNTLNMESNTPDANSIKELISIIGSPDIVITEKVYKKDYDDYILLWETENYILYIAMDGDKCKHVIVCPLKEKDYMISYYMEQFEDGITINCQ